MNGSSKRKILACLAACFGIFLIACAEGGTPREGGFEGLGQGHVTSVEGVIKGEIRHKNFSGGNIILEARSSFPCSYGRCPVIEKKPIGQETFDAPGPFSLPLTELEENIIIIATYENNAGELRVAHHLIEKPEKLQSGFILSLDRPHPPLR